MPSFYGSPWMDAANAGEGFGSAIGNILTQLPALRRQAAIDAARLDLERQRVGYEGDRVQIEREKAPIENAYYKALTSGAEQKTGMEKSAQDMAGIVRQAQILKPQLLNPSLGQNQDVLAGVVNLLRSQGALPQGEVQLPRNDLAGLLDSLARASATQTAVSTPGTAAETIRPVVEPRGSRLTDLITGQEKEGPAYGYAPQRPSDPALLQARDYERALMYLGSIDKLPSRLQRESAKQTPQYQSALQIVQQYRSGRPSAQQGQQPMTATNPQTGQKVQYVNGQWIPLQ